MVHRINCALHRADQISQLEGKAGLNGRGPAGPGDWFAPIVADAEAGFGGDLNAFELMKAMIEAGAPGGPLGGPPGPAEKGGPHGRKGVGATRGVLPEIGHPPLPAHLPPLAPDL